MFIEYVPGEKVNFPFIGEMTVCQLFDPPSPSLIIQENMLFNDRRLDHAKNEVDMLKRKKEKKCWNYEERKTKALLLPILNRIVAPSVGI